MKENIYKRSDGRRQLYRSHDGDWRICHEEHNKRCHDFQKQTVASSAPFSRSNWTYVRNTKYTHKITIQDLKNCKEQTGFQILLDPAIETFQLQSFEDCKAFGNHHSSVKNPVLSFYYTPNYNRSMCLFSHHFTQIVKDYRLSFFIYEIYNVETTVGRATNTTYLLHLQLQHQYISTTFPLTFPSTFLLKNIS